MLSVGQQGQVSKCLQKIIDKEAEKRSKLNKLGEDDNYSAPHEEY